MSRKGGDFKKVVLGFQNFGYDLWGVGGDVWRWLCRHLHWQISAHLEQTFYNCLSIVGGCWIVILSNLWHHWPAICWNSPLLQMLQKGKNCLPHIIGLKRWFCPTEKLEVSCFCPMQSWRKLSFHNGGQGKVFRQMEDNLDFLGKWRMTSTL